MEKPSDFLTIEEGLALIDTDTVKNPTINHAQLVKDIPYLTGNFRGELNYTVHLLKRDEKGKIVKNGKKFIKVLSARDMHTLEYAIVDHYKKVSGRDIDPNTLGLERQTTTIEEDAGMKATPRRNTKSKIKYMDELSQGSGTQMVGEK